MENLSRNDLTSELFNRSRILADAIRGKEGQDVAEAIKALRDCVTVMNKKYVGKGAKVPAQLWCEGQKRNCDDAAIKKLCDDNWKKLISAPMKESVAWEAECLKDEEDDGN